MGSTNAQRRTYPPPLKDAKGYDINLRYRSPDWPMKTGKPLPPFAYTWAARFPKGS